MSPVSFGGLLSKHCHGWVKINTGLRQSTTVKNHMTLLDFSLQHLKILNFFNFVQFLWNVYQNVGLCMFFKKKGMTPEEKGMAQRHAKTGWGKHYCAMSLIQFSACGRIVVSHSWFTSSSLVPSTVQDHRMPRAMPSTMSRIRAFCESTQINSKP